MLDTTNELASSQSRRLEAVRDQLVTLLRQPEVAARLQAAPGESEWSALQTVGHTIEMIPYWLHHCANIIAASEPPTFGRSHDDPERLAAVALGATSGVDLLLTRLNEEVEKAVPAIRRFSASDRARKGLHVRRGEMSVGDILEQFIIAHAEEHLAQVQAALKA